MSKDKPVEMPPAMRVTPAMLDAAMRAFYDLDPNQTWYFHDGKSSQPEVHITREGMLAILAAAEVARR